MRLPNIHLAPGITKSAPSAKCQLAPQKTRVLYEKKVVFTLKNCKRVCRQTSRVRVRTKTEVRKPDNDAIRPEN